MVSSVGKKFRRRTRRKRQRRNHVPWQSKCPSFTMSSRLCWPSQLDNLITAASHNPSYDQNQAWEVPVSFAVNTVSTSGAVCFITCLTPKGWTKGKSVKAGKGREREKAVYGRLPIHLISFVTKLQGRDFSMHLLAWAKAGSQRHFPAKQKYWCVIHKSCQVRCKLHLELEASQWCGTKSL